MPSTSNALSNDCGICALYATRDHNVLSNDCGIYSLYARRDRTSVHCMPREIVLQCSVSYKRSYYSALSATRDRATVHCMPQEIVRKCTVCHKRSCNSALYATKDRATAHCTPQEIGTEVLSIGQHLENSRSGLQHKIAELECCSWMSA